MELLARVSGLTERLARNIVDYRTERGMFSSRAELLNVKGLGPKAYSLCAGFLRIRGAENPLDASGVHPERYEIVNDMAKANGWSVTELMPQSGTVSLGGGRASHAGRHPFRTCKAGA